MQWSFGGGGDERQVDLRLLHLAQFDLGFLGCFLQALHRHAVLGEVDTVVVPERRDHPVDERVVPVVTTELRVAGGGANVEYALSDLKHGHVERATAEVSPTKPFNPGKPIDDNITIIKKPANIGATCCKPRNSAIRRV